MKNQTRKLLELAFGKRASNNFRMRYAEGMGPSYIARLTAQKQSNVSRDANRVRRALDEINAVTKRG